MNLPAFCIRRPAFTIVISLIMIIIGIIGFMNLPVREIPDVTPPSVSITTTYPGASAGLVERDITKVIEAQLSGINGIEMLTSTSSQDESYISMTFKLGRNMDAAVEDVRSSLERVRGDLPKEAENPVVIKANKQTSALLYISFKDTHRNARELSDYINKYIVPIFETVDGVGSVNVYGKRVSAMRVWLDPDKMAAANVTVDDVTQLLHDQNASIPSGQIRSHDRYYEVITNTGLKSVEQFNDLIIRDNQNQAIRLKDIGEAKLDARDKDTAFRINGKAGIVLAIVPQSIVNPLDVEKNLKKAFSDIEKNLPAGMEAKIVYDQADYIRASIHSVYESFAEAVIFVWLVILAFLCSFRATLIPVITIPVCLITTFAILYFMGFSINTITLMAFVLAIGLVVDDAIVMLENISRHIEEGMKPFNAALKGSKEMIFPIIAMTLTLAAVYTPIAFTQGLLGVIFREFTFTLAGAVIISGIVALTLSPMMCARILTVTNTSHSNRFSQWLLQQLNRLQNRYQRILSFLLQKRKWVVVSLIVVAGMGWGVYKFIPSELAPAEDRNEMFVSISVPQGASFQYSDYYMRQMESIYEKIPDIDSYLSIIRSASNSFQFLLLKPKALRKHTPEEIMTTLLAQSSEITGVKVNAFIPPPAIAQFANHDNGQNMGIAITTSSDYPRLQQVIQHMMDAIRQVPGFVYVDNGLKWDSEQFQVDIDRDKAIDLRVPVGTIANTISTFLAGRTIGKLDDADILVQMNEASLANPNIFQQMYVRNIDNKMVSLANLLSVHEATTPSSYDHYERMRSDTIFVSLAPNFKIAAAIKTLEKIAKETLPDDMKFTFTGEAKSFIDSNGKTFFTMFLALIFIYLVLVAQFESFIDPLIIMLTVPFAIVGAMITLKIFGGSLNIYSNIGLITLIGLIAKHGILITEFANRLRATGKSIEEAVIESALLRLRPILMTTAAMTLGALPLAFAFGPGAESRQQIGLVVTGGLLFGTFFSLIVVPVVYTYLAPFRKITHVSSDQETEYATVL